MRWAQYRAVWDYVEGARVPPRGAARPLRRSPAGARPRCRAATCARRSWRRARPVRRRRRDAAAAPAGGGGTGRTRARRRRRGGRASISTRRSSTWSSRPARRSAARGRSRSCAAGAPRWWPQYAYDALAGYGALRPPALRGGARAGRRAARRRAAALHRRPVSQAPRGMKVGGPRLRGRHQPPGADRPRSRPRRRASSSPSPPTSRRPRRWSAPGSRRSPPPAFPIGDYADREQRDGAIAAWLQRARSRAGRAGRLHAAAQRRLPGRLSRRA